MFDISNLNDMKPQWEFWTKTIYDPAIFWAFVTAVATVLLVVATILLVWVGLIPLVRSKKAELAERLKTELLTPRAELMFFLVAHGFLKFAVYKRPNGSEIGYFEIIKADENIIQDRMRQIVGEQRIFMTYEMDDYLLSPLEEVAYYTERKEIAFKDAYRIFGDYIDACWQNKEVVKYIDWLRKHLKADAYRRTEALQKTLRAHYEKLKAKGLTVI